MIGRRSDEPRPGSNELAQNPSRRRFLRRGAVATAGLVAVDQLGPYVLWRNNQTRVEQNRVDTKRLVLVFPGIGRRDANDIVGALHPSLSGPDTTVASLVYADKGVDTAAAAEAILSSGCREFVAIGHSIGGGAAIEVIEHLRPAIKEQRLAVPGFALLNSPHSGQDLVLGVGAARAVAKVPIGLAKKGIGDLATFGHWTPAPPQLEESQLEFAIGFDASRHAPGIADLVGNIIYIGDSSPQGDGVIYTVAASEGYKADLPNMQVVLIDNLGHPDPANNPNQATAYNGVFSGFMRKL